MKLIKTDYSGKLAVISLARSVDSVGKIEHLRCEYLFLFFLIVCLSVAALSGCSSNPIVNEAASKSDRVESADNYQQRNLLNNQSNPAAIIQPVPSPSFSMVYKSWKGTPYRLGGKSKRGIDCSAFVQVGYSDVFNRLLPRTTGEQARMGRWIPRAEAKEGDLVFFKTGRSLRHVGSISVTQSFFMPQRLGES